MNQLYGNKSIMKIISLFFDSPTVILSQTEIISKTKIAKATAIKWLRTLHNKEILNLKIIGRTHQYGLNNENIIVKQLKILHILLQLEELKEIKLLENEEIYLFGSYSRGEYNENSDIDILIISKRKRFEFLIVVENITESIGKNINFQVYSQLEWTILSKKDPAFFDRVEKDKLRII